MKSPPEESLRCVARGVKKAYGDQPILRGVDLDIPEGSFAVLVGPSGCGKSTLLRIVAGLETVDEGSLELAGRDVTRLEPRERDVAMVFQSYALYPHLTVRENLAFGLRLRKTDPRIVDERIREASTMLGLDALLERLPKQLSGGQRQRVAMGRAVVRLAAIYLFDEPLSNLDAALRAEVRVQIRKLHERIGATTLYVTHDQVEAMTLADVLWVLNRGVVEQRGAPLEVYEKPRTKFVAGFLGSPKMNFLEARIEKEGEDIFAIGEGFDGDDGAFRNGQGFRIRLDSTRFPSLEAGRTVILGARPQDATLAREGAVPSLHLKVDLVEILGSEAFAHGHLGAVPFMAHLTADDARKVRANDTIPLAVSSPRVHLFDPVTELALDALPAAIAR